jgi:capsular polysaccharide biosynthesis protein
MGDWILSDFPHFCKTCSTHEHLGIIPIYSIRPSAATPLDKKPRCFSPFTKSQLTYLDNLPIKSNLLVARNTFLAALYVHGRGDGRTVVQSDLTGQIYDLEPEWLYPYTPRLGSDLLHMSQPNISGSIVISDSIFVGTNLSFSHFSAKTLVQLLLLDQYLPISIPIAIPSLKKWQLSQLRYYGISREVYDPLASGAYRSNVVPIYARRCFMIEHVHQWQGLAIVRQLTQAIISKDKATREWPKNPSNVVFLSRYRYETFQSLPHRISNASEFNRHLLQNGIRILFPETLSYPELACILSSAQVIISEPGSGNINSVLFSRDHSHHIQLIPQSFTQHAVSYMAVGGSQWTWPISQQCLLFPSKHNPEHSPHEFNGNRQCVYDANLLLDGLRALINEKGA